MADIQKILDDIKELKLLEVAELVKLMEEEFGVSAAAPVMVAGAVAAEGGAGLCAAAQYRHRRGTGADWYFDDHLSVHYLQYHQVGYLPSPGGDRHYEDVRRYRRFHPVALRGGGHAAGPDGRSGGFLCPVGHLPSGGKTRHPGQRIVSGDHAQLRFHGQDHSWHLLRFRRADWCGWLPDRHS